MRTLLILFSAAAALAAQERGPVPRSTAVRASGEAEVSVRSDQTRLRLAVVTTAGSAERARSKNAERSTAVIARLRELLGQDADIRTSNFSVSNNYSNGFVANNMIDVRLHDPAMTGKAIDIATKAGANVIRGVESAVMDEQDAQAQALKQATVRARANAEAMAAALGLRTMRVVSAEETAVPVPAPILQTGIALQAKQRAAPVTPMEVGTVAVRAHVTVVLEAAPPD